MKNDFMTVGELAKCMGVSVRTLQYYDKENLLKPTAVSEGGRRLYSPKEVIKLHQILSFKSLGFSLEEIKNRILPMDTPKEFALILEQQKKALEEEIQTLREAADMLEKLHGEALAMEKVDFKKYADIIELLKMNNPAYWVYKYFDDGLADHIRNRFKDQPETGLEIFETYKTLAEEALRLNRGGESPTSEKSIALAEKWWNMVMEFTGGDMSLLPQLVAFNDKKDSWDNTMGEKQKEIDDYVEAILTAYFERNGAQAPEGI